jgi:hypothetical protein
LNGTGEEGGGRGNGKLNAMGGGKSKGFCLDFLILFIRTSRKDGFKQPFGDFIGRNLKFELSFHARGRNN